MAIADETRWLDATAQAALVRKGEVTPSELVEAAIERVERLNAPLNAVIQPLFDKARAAASGDLPGGPFRGVPFLVKDLFAPSAADPMHNGMAAMRKADFRAPIDSTLVQRHRRAGLVTVGRTNTPELGILPTTEPDAYGATANPWDVSRSPGGSSGGSGAAVAAGMVPFAHASDGGGSIRIPASCCGLVGLKVSQGRTSLGPLGDESGLSVQHAVTRSVRDTAALLDATHGPGVGDTMIAPAPIRPFSDEVGADPGQLRIGLLARNPRGKLDPECEEAARATAALLADLGHHVEEAHPAAFEDDGMVGVFTVLWATNVRAVLTATAQIVGRELGPDDVEPLTWALAEQAQTFSAADHLLALAASASFRRAAQQWWADGWDVLVTPTLAGLPPKLGEMAQNAAHPLAPFAAAADLVPFTPLLNVSGQPAISLPLHWSASGLPVGVQLVGGYGREDVLIRVSAQLEAARPWADRHPRA